MSSGVQYFPQTLPPNTVVGRISPTAGATEAIPLAALAASLTGLTDALDYQFIGGPVTGGTATTPAAVAFSTTPTFVCSGSNTTSNVFNFGIMTANVTSVTLSTPLDGQTINIFFTQDATGSRTIAWPSSFKWPGGTAGVLSTAANAVDCLVATYRASTGFWYCNLLKAFA